MRRTAHALLAVLLAGLAPASASAQGTGSHDGHGAHATTTPQAVADLPSVKSYKEANDKMHKDMAIAFSGNADVDFVRGMIPHHQGAIDMAKVVLAHGKDPAIRRLARNVIQAQEAEIKTMRAWLAKNEGRR